MCGACASARELISIGRDGGDDGPAGGGAEAAREAVGGWWRGVGRGPAGGGRPGGSRERGRAGLGLAGGGGSGAAGVPAIGGVEGVVGVAVAAGWAGVGAREGPRRALRAPSRGDAFCTFLLVVAALHACVGAWKVLRSDPEVPPPLA